MRNEVAISPQYRQQRESTLCCRAADDKRALPTCIAQCQILRPLSPYGVRKDISRSGGANGPAALRRKTKTSSPSASLATGTLPLSVRVIDSRCHVDERINVPWQLPGSEPAFISPDNPSKSVVQRYVAPATVCRQRAELKWNTPQQCASLA
ncbi:hypothetical protein DPEC_G00368130 [Dallia pectoralis]|nr:hypothetical protein DPEC_G00368130 [Dallia pectoralis]